jgi:hypothetical protein
MVNKGYMPRAFEKLRTWAINFITYVTEKDVIARLGLDTTRLGALSDEIDAYKEACTQADKANAGSVDRLDRKEKAQKLAKSCRHFVNAFLRYNEAMTDDDRKQIGLTIPDTKPTDEEVDDTEYPDIEADTRVLRQIKCRFLNREHRVSKPRHVHGTEMVFGFIPAGEKPSLTHLKNSVFSTRSFKTLTFSDEERGLRVGLCARYENNTGGKGPFGPILVVFIP